MYVFLSTACLCNSNSSTTDHDVYLVVPSTTQQQARIMAHEPPPTYLNVSITCSGPLTHASDNTCFIPATAVAAAAAADDDNGDNDDDDDDDELSATPSTVVRPITTSSTTATRPAFHVWVTLLWTVSRISVYQSH